MKKLENWTKEELIAEVGRLRRFQKKKEVFLVNEASSGEIFQNLLIAYYKSTLDGVLINYNDEFCKIFGLDTHFNHTGISLRDFWFDVNERETYIKNLNSTTGLINYLIKAKRLNGDIIYVQLNARLLSIPESAQKIIEGVFIDRTQQILDEEALKINHELFNTVLQNMIQGIQILDTDLCYKYINDAAEHHFGFSSEKCYGKQILEVWPEIKYNQLIDSIENSRINTKKTRLQVEHVNSDNSLSWIELSIQPIPDGIIIHSIDITKSKLAELKLQESEEKYRLLADNSIDCIWQVDMQLRLTYLSPSVYNLVGFTPTEIIGTSIWKYISKEEFLKLSRLALEILHREKDVMLIQTKLYDRQGLQKDVEIHGQLITKNNEIIGLQGSIRDITRQKEIEKSLLSSERTLQLFVKYTPASVAMFDREMKYIFASNRYLLDYKLHDQNLTGRSHYEVFPEIPDRWKKIHKKCLNGESARNDKDKFVRQNGSIDWVRWEIRPWYDFDNSIGGIILFSEVITDLVQATEKIKVERDRFRILADTVPGVICSFRLAPDGSQGMPFSTASIFNLYGYTSEELAHDFTPVMDRIHPDDIEKVSQSISDSAQHMTPWNCEFRYDHPERGYIWIEGHSVPVLDNDGSIIWHGFIWDISQRKNNEISLKEKQELLSEVGKMAKIGGWEFNVETLDGNFTDEVRKIHELEEDEHMNVNRALEFYVGDSKTIIEKAVSESINEAKSYDLELKFRDAKGSIKWIRTIGKPILEGDNVVKVRGTFQDITDQKKIRDELDKYQAKLEEKVKLRTDELVKRNAELADKNRELNQFNELFINREFRIKELKERIKALENQIKD